MCIHPTELYIQPSSSALIIAVSTTTRVVDIYVQGEGQAVCSTPLDLAFILTMDQITFALSLEGHEDWIRSLSFSPSTSEDGDNKTLTLASGSQDGYIRLWLIKPNTPKVVDPESTDPTDELLDAFERSLNEVGLDEPGRQLSTREHIFSVRGSDGQYVQLIPKRKTRAKLACVDR